MKVRYSCVLVFAVSIALFATKAVAAPTSFIERFATITPVASTVPANGDVNPYGVALVHRTVDALVRDHILVSNFNNSQNQQGTGTTIVDVAPDGTMKVFAEITSPMAADCPGGIGLTTALAVLRSGWVVVGSLPTSDGSPEHARAGCLIVLNSHGDVKRTIHGGLINGPWDMTVSDGDDAAVLFVSNVLNGTVAANGGTVDRGTVVRLRLAFDEGEDRVPRVESETTIGSHFAEHTDPAALVIGPTGLGLARDGTLYVADTANNRIAAISHALTRENSADMGKTVFSGGALNAPLGLSIAPNGHIVVVNGNDGNILEITPAGEQIAVMDSGFGAGALFGLAIAPNQAGIYLVNDGDNTLQLLH
jgi:hypothetical protein